MTVGGPADGTRLAWAPGLVLPWGVGEPQTESVRLAASKYADVRESFLAGEFAQERSLDEHIASHRSLLRSDKALEADWLTTAEAFYYVTPMIGSVQGGLLPPAAGWYSDPSGQPWLRYWDGATWTEHYAIETPTRSGTSNE